VLLFRPEKCLKLPINRGFDMPDDLPIFLLSIVLFALYLVGSAATEMGTVWPWPRQKQDSLTLLSSDQVSSDQAETDSQD
jgi:hypothetical protein